MKLLSPVDSMFVRMETSRAPLHIGCAAIFELPESDHQVTLAELREAHEGFFPNLMGADAALA